jgi:hypothetical protein
MTHYVRPLSLTWAGLKTSSSPEQARPALSGTITLGIALRYLAQRRPKAALLQFPRKSEPLPAE